MASRAKVLYRAILQAHRRQLPSDLRDFGDMYVRNEFNLFKKVTKPEELAKFYSEWDGYLRSLTQSAPQQQGNKFGRDLTEAEKTAMSKEQHDKLGEFLTELRKPGE